MSRVALASLIVGVGLVAILCWEAKSAVYSGASDLPGRPAPSGLVAIVPTPAPADPVEAWVATSLERPLLRESRRPDKVVRESQGKGDDILRLAAVMTGPFGDRAIFIMPGSAKPVVAKIGTQVSDFVVRSIEPGRVVVETNDVKRTFKPIYAGGNPKPPAGSKR
jgi:hypothetical protein